MYLSKNLDAIKKVSQDGFELEKMLQSVIPSEEVALYETQDGSYTVEYQGILLHDEKGAAKEAKRVADETCRPGKNTIHVLVGLGLGYLLDDVFKRSAGPIVIYEPHLPLLLYVLENADLSSYLESGRVSLTTTQSELTQCLSQTYTYGNLLDILVLRGYLELLRADLTSILKTLKQFLADAKLDAQTVAYQGGMWVENFFENLPAVSQAIPADVLFNTFNGKPALMVSNGPSVDKALPEIKALQDSLLLINLGGTLRLLLEQGIPPDMTVFVDARGADRQLAQLPCEPTKTRFMLTPYTQPCCFNVPVRENYLLLDTLDTTFAPWLEEQWGRALGRVGGGPSVSIFALQLAIAMGCDPIIIVGQDLALQGDQIYAGGIQANIDPATGSLEVPFTETQQGVEYDLAEIKGQNGEMLKTTTAYLRFARYIEDVVRTVQKGPSPRRFINASEGGAYLEGFEHLSLKEVLETLPLTPLDKEALLSAHSSASIQDSARIFPQALTDLIQAIEEGIRQSQEAVSKLKEWNALPEQLEGRVPSYQALQQSFKTHLEQFPFMAGCLHPKTLEFVALNQGDGTLQERFQWAQDYFETCLNTLQNDLLPQVVNTQQRFAHRV